MDFPGTPRTMCLTGAAGTLVVAVCCFTPVLVVAVTAAGLGAAVAYLDIVLLPALAVFAAVTLAGAWRWWAACR